MTLTFTPATWDELCQQAPATPPRAPQLDSFEIEGMPNGICHGYACSLHLSPGLFLGFCQRDNHQDWNLAVAAHDHPIQMVIWLSGFTDFDAVHPKLGGGSRLFFWEWDFASLCRKASGWRTSSLCKR